MVLKNQKKEAYQATGEDCSVRIDFWDESVVEIMEIISKAADLIERQTKNLDVP